METLRSWKWTIAAIVLALLAFYALWDFVWVNFIHSGSADK